MIRLLPCPQCRRHVNNAEAVCPFCQAAMASDQPRAALPLPVGRLGRIAVLAAGASLVGVATSCSDSPSNTDAGAGGQAGLGGSSGAAGTSSAGGGAGTAGSGGGSSTDAGQEYDGPIAIYSAAIALPKNKT